MSTTGSSKFSKSRMKNRTRLSAGLLALTLTLAAAAWAERPGLGPSQWQEGLNKVDAKLRAGKWKPGARAARKLAEEVLSHSWHDRELKRILAELAFYQAAASANLGQKDKAVWYWHMAQNVDRRIREKDLAPYGAAGNLLLEFPLRQKGRAPPNFPVVEPVAGRFVHAVKDPGWSPVVPYSPGHGERSGDLHVELIVDRHGQPHHPVILTDPHPIVVYGTLDALSTMPHFEPARDSGEPVDSLFRYAVTPTYSRWDQGGNTLKGTIKNR